MLSLFWSYSLQKDVKRFVETIEHGELAHMVERSLSMREVPGSIPGFSTHFSCDFNFFVKAYWYQEYKYISSCQHLPITSKKMSFTLAFYDSFLDIFQKKIQLAPKKTLQRFSGFEFERTIKLGSRSRAPGFRVLNDSGYY